MKFFSRKTGGIAVLVAFLGLAFWYGQRPENPVGPLLWPPEPTPTPDLRTKIGQEIVVGNLKLKAIDAIKIARPTEAEDLGVITVRFTGMPDCDDVEASCRFDTNKFKLWDEQGNLQPTASAPSKYIPGFRPLQLVSSRELIRKTFEEGQIYFRLNKTGQEYVLSYTGNDGVESRIYIEPRLYSTEEAAKNLSTTPWPYKVVEQK